MQVFAWRTAMLALAVASSAMAQQATPLAALVEEAKAQNSSLTAAEHATRAARLMAPQKGTLPDPIFTVQQFSVGSPRPFAGYSNSDFAYLGLGVSQELPYPGKLRLRAEVADRDADTKAAETVALSADLTGAVKTDYVQLAYLQQTLVLLLQSRDLLDQVIADATERYKIGQGMQQDILQAQVERTNLTRELTMHHQEMAAIQAHLKGLLHRPQTATDIVAEDLGESSLRITDVELRALVEKQNPQVQVEASRVRKQDAQVSAARRESKPDFELGYQYENTDRKYRDYYMLTLSLRLPRKKRVDAEVGEAAEMLAQSRATLDAHLQQQLAETQQAYVKVTGDAELLKEYREGLVPQSEAASRATLSAYGLNKEQFTRVLQSFASVLQLKLGYAQTLVDHETALIRLETLTGASLR